MTPKLSRTDEPTSNDKSKTVNSGAMETPRTRPLRKASSIASELIKGVIRKPSTASTVSASVLVAQSEKRGATTRSKKSVTPKTRHRERKSSSQIDPVTDDGSNLEATMPRWMEILKNYVDHPEQAASTQNEVPQPNYEAASMVELKELERKLGFLEARMDQLEATIVPQTGEIAGQFMQQVEQGVHFLAAPPDAPLVQRLCPAIYLEELQKQLGNFNTEHPAAMLNQYSPLVSFQQDGATRYTSGFDGVNMMKPRHALEALDPSGISLANPDTAGVSTIDVSALSEMQLWGLDRTEDEQNLGPEEFGGSSARTRC